jgi:hypothetical protein
MGRADTTTKSQPERQVGSGPGGDGVFGIQMTRGVSSIAELTL